MAREIRHRLTDIDPEARTAICASCGPVRVRRKNKAGWRCSPGDRRTTPEERARQAETQRRHYHADVERSRARQREKYATHIEAHQARDQRRYWRDRDARLARAKDWRQRNPEKTRELHARRRAGVEKKRLDYTLIARRDGAVCYLCDRSVRPWVAGQYEHDFQVMDHIVPLVLGGAHDYHNVAVACHRCNGIKGRKHPEQLLGEFQDRALAKLSALASHPLP